MLNGCGDDYRQQEEILNVPAKRLLYSLAINDNPVYEYKVRMSLVIKEISKILEAEFGEVTLEQNDDQLMYVTPKVRLTVNGVDKQTECIFTVKDIDKQNTIIEASCDVQAYWTRWNKPKTPNLFDFISWKSGWYYDSDAAHSLDIKMLEKINSNLRLNDTDTIRYKNIFEFEKSKIDRVKSKVEGQAEVASQIRTVSRPPSN